MTVSSAGGFWTFGTRIAVLPQPLIATMKTFLSLFLLAAFPLPSSAALVAQNFNSIPDGPLVNDAAWTAFSGADDSVTVAGGLVSLGSGAEDVGTVIGSDISNLYFGVTIVVSAGDTCEIKVDANVPARFPEVISVGSSTAEPVGGRVTG